MMTPPQERRREQKQRRKRRNKNRKRRGKKLCCKKGVQAKLAAKDGEAPCDQAPNATLKSAMVYLLI